MVAAAEHALHDERDAQRVEDAVLLGDAPPSLAVVGKFGTPLQQLLVSGARFNTLKNITKIIPKVQFEKE